MSTSDLTIEQHVRALRDAVESQYETAVNLAKVERDKAIAAIDKLQTDLLGGSPGREKKQETEPRMTTRPKRGAKKVGATEAIREFIASHPGGVDRGAIVDAVTEATGANRSAVHASVSMLEKRGHLRRDDANRMFAN